MSNVELHFFAANDLNGSTLLEISDEEDYFKSLEIRIALNELGSGQFTLARKVGFSLFDSGAVQPEVFVRVLIPAISPTDYVWGFFLDARMQKVISSDEQGGEEFVFGGPGPMFYLSRAILWDEAFAGAGWNVDTANGIYRFNGTTSAGRVLQFLFNDNAANTIADFLPDLTRTFTDTDDSDSNAWVDDFGSEFFELPIGQTFLEDAWAVQDAIPDLSYQINLGTVAAPLMEWGAFQAYGRDLSGGTFTAGNVLFYEGDQPTGNGNIVGDLTVNGSSLRFASHVLVHGAEGSYGRAVRTTYDPGEYAKAAFIEYSNVPNENVLERRGLRWLRHQDNGANEIVFEILPGFDESEGHYFPGPIGSSGHFWVGDIVTLTTGGSVSWTPLDYRFEEERVTAIRMVLDEAAVDTDSTTQALSWHVIPELNVERASASISDQGGGATGCNCLHLCTDTCTTLPTEILAKFRFNRATSAAESGVSIGMRQSAGYGNATDWAWRIGARVGDLGDVAGEPDFASLYLNGNVWDGANDWTLVNPVLSVTTIGTDWFWLRVEATAGEVNARAWRDGDSEPGSWQYTVEQGGDQPIEGCNFNFLDVTASPSPTTSIEWDSVQFVSGISSTTADAFSRSETGELGISPINDKCWMMIAGPSTTDDVVVDGAKAVISGQIYANLPVRETCIHGGPGANGGDPAEACHNQAAPCNHEHDYVPAGGTAGQVLAKRSDCDLDTEWSDSGGTGDILDHTTTETDDTLVLAPDGAGGVEFRAETGGGSVPSGTDPGDLLVWDGDSWEILPVGFDGEIIVADSAEALGLKWTSIGSYDLTRYTGGDIALTSTSMAAVSGPADILVSAKTGDVLLIGLSVRAVANDADSIGLDVATMVSGSAVNFVSSTTGTAVTTGISGWFITGDASATPSGGGSIVYVVQAGDVDTASVTLRLYARVSGNRSLGAAAANPLVFWVKNLLQ